MSAKEELIAEDIQVITDEFRRLHALCEEMGESIESLLWLINRDAPQLSGKRIGYAETTLAKWKESK